MTLALIYELAFEHFCMNDFRSSSVRYVGTTVTGAVGLMSGISRNGDISMECVVSVSQILRTLMRSLQSKYVFLSCIFSSALSQYNVCLFF